MIKILKYTENPLTLMGQMASVCTNQKDESKYKQIAIDSINSGHGRVLEYSDIIIEISGYSARMVRELYTSIIGVTRLQESTRYVDCSDFQYYIPDSIKNNEQALANYEVTMAMIQSSYQFLTGDCKIPKQDTANILPLGMFTKVCLKINLRALLHMAELRICNRALKEYRDFMQELKDTLSEIDDEWEYIIDNYYKPKCEKIRYCEEKNSCGKYSILKKNLNY